MQVTYNAIATLREQIGRAVLGKTRQIDLVLTALLARGHILIEDLPGLGKTTLARALARSLHATFKRTQFTPDLLPSDVLGTTVYNQHTGEFKWRAGPVFTQILLVDEINRATPRTQSALLEAMNEGCVSADSETHQLPKPFMVIATQNPIEHAGTYPLPESQLDRFTLRISMGYPALEQEREMLNSFSSRDSVELVEPVMSAEDVINVQAAVANVRMDDAIRDYMLAIITATRTHSRLIAGVSPRGSLALYRACQAYAAVNGRDYVVPDDVKALAVPALAHRVIERSSGDASSTAAPGEATIRAILEKVDVPV